MTEQTPITRSATRHDGWTEARATQFLDSLAAEGSVRAACGRAGMSREAAYRLRRRDALFARAWNAALVLAREANAEVLENRAIHGMEEDIWYRGELVGTRRKYDSRLLLAHMARLDKIAENDRAAEDAARFDELLATIGGQSAPEGQDRDDDGLPVERGIFVDIAVDDAEVAFAEAWTDAHPSEEDEEETDPAEIAARADREVAEYQTYKAALVDEKWRVILAAGVQWDEWRERSHRAVDRLLSEPAGDAGTVSTVSTSLARGTPYASVTQAYGGQAGQSQVGAGVS